MRWWERLRRILTITATHRGFQSVLVRLRLRHVAHGTYDQKSSKGQWPTSRQRYTAWSYSSNPYPRARRSHDQCYRQCYRHNPCRQDTEGPVSSQELKGIVTVFLKKQSRPLRLTPSSRRCQAFTSEPTFFFFVFSAVSSFLGPVCSSLAIFCITPNKQTNKAKQPPEPPPKQQQQQKTNNISKGLPVNLVCRKEKEEEDIFLSPLTPAV